MNEERKSSFTIGTAGKTKECVFCGAEFEFKNPRQDHCSHRCAIMKSRHNRNPFIGSRIGQEKKCKYCGETFNDFSKNGCGLYCSKKCAGKFKNYNVLDSVRGRAKKKGLAFNLEMSDVKVPHFCPILGIPLIKGKEEYYNSPTVDRTDNSKGYIKGNIQIMSRAANQLKCDMPLQVWKKVLEMIENGTKNYRK